MSTSIEPTVAAVASSPSTASLSDQKAPTPTPTRKTPSRKRKHEEKDGEEKKTNKSKKQKSTLSPQPKCVAKWKMQTSEQKLLDVIQQNVIKCVIEYEGSCFDNLLLRLSILNALCDMSQEEIKRYRTMCDVPEPISTQIKLVDKKQPFVFQLNPKTKHEDGYHHQAGDPLFSTSVTCVSDAPNREQL